MNPFLLTDGYKTGHHLMYPENTSLVYSNFTPRSNKYAPTGCDKVVSFGQQMTIRLIKQYFENSFFCIPETGKLRMAKVHNNGKLPKKAQSTLDKVKSRVCGEIKKEYSMYLGYDYDVSHIEALWDIGYLPIRVKALPEGSLVPMGVPVLTIYNTRPEFYWLTNFLETLISNLLWKPMTSATIAHQYKKNLTKWAEKTDKDNLEFVEFQGHDFSMRGMDSPLATITSGLGHATSFKGSDSLPVITGARSFYDETDFVVGSVPATEHSVMCAGSKDDEIGTFRRLMEQFPTGILSVVSDTWNLWDVITKFLPELKDEILSRDGKLVIRPDSGDPVDIVCGTNVFKSDKPVQQRKTSNEHNVNPEQKGVIELLWDIFGGTVNEQGYKVLDPHIGAIYGDSITLDRAEEICKRLEAKGFASTNIVLGIGSFTYQYNTRDTFGFAMKATYIEVLEPTEYEGKEAFAVVGREIFKDPITDDGTKKSAKGLLKVDMTPEGDFYLEDQVTWEDEGNGALETIFNNGVLRNQTTLTEIRETLNNY